MRDPDTLQEIGRLKRRADFLRAAKGKRWHAGALSLQASPAVAAGSGVRVGFTLTRKVGNAVVRNRGRRRLKEAVRLCPDLPVVAGHDYVIIGRVEALRLPFESLKRDLARAIRGVHESGRQRGETGKRSKSGTGSKSGIGSKSGTGFKSGTGSDQEIHAQAPPSPTTPSRDIRPKRTRPEP